MRAAATGTNTDEASDGDTADPRRLADAARECAALQAADRLAGWVGDGRVVQTAPVLYPVQLATAARALDSDGAAVLPAWSRAQHAGLIETRGDRTVAGPGLDAWRRGEPSIVLELWREAYDSYTGLDGRSSDEPYVRPEAFGAQAALRLLAARRRPIATSKVRAKVARMLRAAERGSAPGLLDPDRDAAAGLALLEEFGASDSDGQTSWLTPLGQWLIRARRQPDSWARALIEHLYVRGLDAGDALAQRWLSSRNPARVVRDLFTAVAEGAAAERTIAMALARKTGSAAESEWRRWVDHPTIGPHARLWLATIVDGDDPDESDADWALLDQMAGTLRRADCPSVRDAIRWHCHEALGLEATRRMAAVEHPDRDLMVEVLAERHAFQQYYRLRVELCDVGEPEVWRRVLIPAGSTLPELHRALCTAVGWDGHHEYVVQIGDRTHTSFDEDQPSMIGLRLGDLVTAGDQFEYEYDELARWRHVVVVEADDEQAPQGQWAWVIDGSGACPPQECGGVEEYRRLRSALSDPSDEYAEYARMVFAVDRPEDFDPDGFDPTLPNALFAADSAAAVRAA